MPRSGSSSALLYRRLPHAQMRDAAAPSAPLGPSRGIVYKLAALFSLDAFAGGFVVQSLLALWLFERFDLSLSAASLFFFWSSALERVFLSGGGLAGRTHRPDQHDGVHPHSVQPLSDPGGVLAQSVPGARPAAAALRAVADGRADAHLLRDGGGDAGRAHRRRERHRGAAQPRVVDQPGDRRRAAGDAVLRLCRWSSAACSRSSTTSRCSSRSGTSSRRRSRQVWRLENSAVNRASGDLGGRQVGERPRRSQAFAAAQR